ncbi:MAG: hypothetical protein MRQ08_04800 [Candidatus Midichloria mitochondrii]|nr:hypothetical protein [Candidatus Midichloria mitochondrii]
MLYKRFREFVQNFKKPAARGNIISGSQKLPASQFSSTTPFPDRDRRMDKIAIIKVAHLAIIKTFFSVIGTNGKITSFVTSVLVVFSQESAVDIITASKPAITKPFTPITR